ncbi:MAG TPA: FHA domain-containing protein [Gemmatales bacterium]|nr:FHA domain-containing protein [Gemmatales bacterium]HMP60016.1 FHA domain-containing protein [Gemmatales bacterium]
MAVMRPHGELVPTGGGDSITLDREVMSVGRRESCEICLRFPNISSVHSELVFRDGYWYVHDKGSTNGTKVNGMRVLKKVLIPGDELSFAKRKYTIKYNIPSDKRMEELLEEEDVMSHSLLERAGLEKAREEEDDWLSDMSPTPPPSHRTPHPRYDR